MYSLNLNFQVLILEYSGGGGGGGGGGQAHICIPVQCQFSIWLADNNESYARIPRLT